MVRTDTQNLLRESAVWNLAVGLPSMIRLGAPAASVDRSHLVFSVFGRASSGFILQGSTNLSYWTSLSTNRFFDGQLDFIDPSGGNLGAQFFRGLCIP